MAVEDVFQIFMDRLFRQFNLCGIILDLSMLVRLSNIRYWPILSSVQSYVSRSWMLKIDIMFHKWISFNSTILFSVFYFYFFCFYHLFLFLFHRMPVSHGTNILCPDILASFSFLWFLFNITNYATARCFCYSCQCVGIIKHSTGNSAIPWPGWISPKTSRKSMKCLAISFVSIPWWRSENYLLWSIVT